MAWIIKAAACYLGDRDKLVDVPEEAHKFHYKHEAKDHAIVWALFNQWADNSAIDVTVVKAPKKKK